MTNKTISNLLLVALGLSIFTTGFITDYNTSETLYTISGVMILVFGIWGAIKLIK